jgi:hypothetical protein
VQNAVELPGVGQAAGVPRTEHVEPYVNQFPKDQVLGNRLIID